MNLRQIGCIALTLSLLAPGLSGASALNVDSFSDGLKLGHRNGSIIVERIKDRTLGLRGCDGLDGFLGALKVLLSSVRAPLGSSQQLSAGFYQGYLNAIQEALLAGRSSCGLGAFSSGGYIGELYGGLLCSIANIDIGIVSLIELLPIQQGWTGGLESVSLQCLGSATLTIQTCLEGELSSVLQVAIAQSCSDVVL